MFDHWRNILSNNQKVAENYLSMTSLQVMNIGIALLTYPYIIRAIGKEAFGEYAFSLAIVTFFFTLINFGIDLPYAKNTALHSDDKPYLENILGSILTTKIYLALGSGMICAVLTYIIPTFRNCVVLIAISFSQVIFHILFPQWYYQGRQKMRAVTIVQLVIKVVSIPFLFVCLKQAEDVWKYAVINSIVAILSGLIVWIMIRRYDHMHIHWASLGEVKKVLHESLPFCITNMTGMLKEQGVVILIGQFLNMSDVAIYDLANKIITIPRTIIMRINDALYPKVITEGNPQMVQKIIKREYFIGMGIMAAVVLLGKWAVLLLGGASMMDAWGVSGILSVTILSWMVVGAIIAFRIIPSNQTHWIAINQGIACCVCLLVAGIGALIGGNVYAIASGIAAAGIGEIIFCTWVSKKIVVQKDD